MLSRGRFRDFSRGVLYHFKGGLHFYFWFSKGERFHSEDALSLPYFSKIF
jgi:hypothetical protein